MDDAEIREQELHDRRMERYAREREEKAQLLSELIALREANRALKEERSRLIREITTLRDAVNLAMYRAIFGDAK